MEDKTKLTEAFIRSIRFDSEYLNNLDVFLKTNFKKVFYTLKTNKRSFEKKELSEMLLSVKKIDNENIQNIEVFAYKNVEVTLWGSEDLCLTFYKRYLLPTVIYTYKDGQENEDVGFLKKLDDFLKKYRFNYAFIFDDGVFPSVLKAILGIIAQFGIASGMAYIYLWSINVNVVFYSWIYLLVLAVSFNIVSGVFKYFFPRLVFILTKKEKDYRCRYDFTRKSLLWFIGVLFPIALGILIDRYFIK